MKEGVMSHSPVKVVCCQTTHDDDGLSFSWYAFEEENVVQDFVLYFNDKLVRNFVSSIRILRQDSVLLML